MDGETKINFEQIPSACFVLEEEKLVRNLEILKSLREEAGITILLALKGFAMFSTFELLTKYLPGTTASSLNEAKLGAEFFGPNVHAYAPVYADAELEEIIKVCSHVTFNSLSQWERHREKFASSNVSPGIRINPEYSTVEADVYNPCAPGSRLGVLGSDLEVLPAGIEGLHCHNLCESGVDAFEKTLAAIEEKFGQHLEQLKWLNFGGGHLLTDDSYDRPKLITLLKDLKARYPNLEIILEPGAACAWQTGYLVSTVLDVVESSGVKTAMLDVSVAAHMPDCLEMPYKPKVFGAVENSEHKYRLGGTTCLAGDYLEDYYFERPLKIGDKVVFKDMMHYTMVKTTNFNGVAHPSIGIWRGDKFQLVKNFGYDDYKSRLS